MVKFVVFPGVVRIIEAIQKAETGNYLKAEEYLKQPTEDEEFAVAHLFHEVQKESNNPLVLHPLTQMNS
jgi:cellobiose-specific phosphotransferase system component IIA